MIQSGVQGNPVLMVAHLLLAACSTGYLVWWWLFFNPVHESPSGGCYFFGVACIVGAALLGIAGVICLLGGIGALAETFKSVPLWAFAVAGIVLYLVLLLVTTGLFKRPATTELLLFVAWCVLEIMVLYVLLGAQVMPTFQVVALAVLVIALTVLSLVCYVLYYQLAPITSFVAGALPLVAVGIFSLLMTLLLLLANKL